MIDITVSLSEKSDTYAGMENSLTNGKYCDL